MSVTLRYPKITATDGHEQLAQIRSYLFQLVGELQAALDENAVQTVARGGALASVQTPQENFSEIKSLIIRSAEIVNAYSEEVRKRLEGVYLARSDFGTFSEQTAQEIAANATALESVFNYVGTLQTEMNSVQNKLTESRAYIRSGLLTHTEAGEPVYGMEIGQRIAVNGEERFDKYARFTPDRLSFYDQNGSEVAYISDYKLHVTSAEIRGSLTLGGYAVKTEDGVAWKWQEGAP